VIWATSFSVQTTVFRFQKPGRTRDYSFQCLPPAPGGAANNFENEQNDVADVSDARTGLTNRQKVVRYLTTRCQSNLEACLSVRALYRYVKVVG